MKLTKQSIETILGRKLSDFEYEFIIKYREAKVNNKKLLVYFGRQNGRTRLFTEATMISVKK